MKINEREGLVMSKVSGSLENRKFNEVLGHNKGLGFSRDILGSLYDIYIERKGVLSDEVQGECRVYGDKSITITADSLKEDLRSGELTDIVKETLLHELCHAFLHESGLVDESDDERLVHWLSINIPKIMTVYESITQSIGNSNDTATSEDVAKEKHFSGYDPKDYLEFPRDFREREE